MAPQGQGAPFPHRHRGLWLQAPRGLPLGVQQPLCASSARALGARSLLGLILLPERMQAMSPEVTAMKEGQL